MNQPITWQAIGEDMLAYSERKKAKQKAIAEEIGKLEAMSQRHSPIDPSELAEIVSALKVNAA